MISYSSVLESASLLQERREDFVAAMARYLSQSGAPSSNDTTAARILLDATLASLAGQQASARLVIDEDHIKHYLSRFGDGLSPILRDILGAQVPTSFVSRCVDGYWRTVNRLAPALVA